MKAFTKQSLLLFILITTLSVTYADEFVVRSFIPAPADLSAIQYEYLDVNDQKCAIIKIRTDLRNLSFDSGKNLAKDIEFHNGEYWMYVSPGEKRLTIIKDGFITLHYPIQIPVVASRVYILEITNQEKGSASTGSMIINTEPQGAEIRIKELSDLRVISPAELIDYPAFPYSISISNTRYANIDTILTLHPNETISHNIILKPLWGDLIITVEPPDAEIYVDDQFFGSGMQQLISAESGINLGSHKIKVLKEAYHSQERTIEITNGNNGTLEFSLRPIMGFLSIDVLPADAQVLINGITIEKIPFMDSVQVGTYQIDMGKETYLSMNKTVEVLPNQKTTVFEELPHTKTIRLSSSPSQADIFLDGDYLGKTPENILLAYGSNNIVLKKDNYEDLNSPVIVDRDTKKINLTLQARKYDITISSSPSNASVYIDKVRISQTPTNMKVPYGSYNVKIEKRGYFRKRKNINIKHDDQRFNFNLQTLKHLRFGFIKGAESWGGEITYVNNLAGIGIGYYQPPKLTFDHEIDYPNINLGNYLDLVPNNSIGTVTNQDSINYKITGKVHICLNKVPTFSFVLGMAIGRIHYSEVYQADDIYESYFYGENIHKGEYYSVPKKGKLKASPILGVSARIFRYLYANAEYWFLTEKGTAFFFGGGVCIPLN